MISRKIQVVFSIFLASTISLSAQYQPFEISPIHPLSAGLAQEGTAIQERGINLAGNTAFLAGNSEKYVEGGIFLGLMDQVTSPILPSNIGIYYPMAKDYGLGFRLRTQYHSNFPALERSNYINSHLFASYTFSDLFYVSLGLGPSYGVRGRERSNATISSFIGLGLQTKSFRIGMTGTHSGGKLNYQVYRNGDSLIERLPPYATLGFSYIFNEKLEFTAELKKLFQEYSSFNLNNSENKPNFERGLGSELSTSIGVLLKVKRESSWSVGTGIQIGGKFNSLGENKRGTGLGFGFYYSPDPDGKNINLYFGILDYSVLATKKSRYPETNFLFSIGYSW